jgi:hypothetical protein
MTVTTSRRRLPAPLARLPRADLAFALAVIIVYLGATAVVMVLTNVDPDRMWYVAQSALHGHLDSDKLKGAVDIVDMNGRYYIAVGPLQLLPYLPFAFFTALQGVTRYIVCLAFAIPAALLSLPLARAYGARGADAFWIAISTSFGSLLFFVTVFGNMYWLAHAESFLALTIFLLEWAGRKRPLVLGASIAFSFVARPTTALALVPFGLVLLWQHRQRVALVVRDVVLVGAPILLAIGFYAWFNWLRFGSPLETGYAISYLSQPSLEARREMGLFSLAQIPENIRLAFLLPPSLIGHFPFISPSKFGMSMLLVSPALFTAIWAGFRDRTALLLWIAAGLVAVPVFLYYGGGYVQYGFRYSLDFTPFLVALMAIGSRRWIGWPERALVLAGVASVAFGIVWHTR